MTNDETLLIALFWGCSIILFYKWYSLNKKIKGMNTITCKCSDKTLRTTYQKNIYIYYYDYFVNDEKYSASDQTRFKLPFFNPKINDEFTIYIASKNPNSVITPYQLIKHKLCLFIALTLLILPLLFLI